MAEKKISIIGNDEEFARIHANKFFVQFDYPVDNEGNGVSAEFFSENEETAKKEALEVYNEQFKEEAKGKMIKFIRYHTASEVAQFCIEKYGTAYPNKIECGNIEWRHVPWFAMPYSPMEMRAKPYFVDPEAQKYNLPFEEEIQKHWEKHPNPVGKLGRIHLYSKNGAREYFKNHPEHEQFREPIQKWHEELLRIEKKQWDEERKKIKNKCQNKISHLLTPEQLELLGINFNVYERKYQGGKAYIELKGKKLEIVPEIKVAVDNS